MKVGFFGDSLTEGISGASFLQVLEREIPQHTLLNFGKGGDTVISLYRRIRSLSFDPLLDLAFIWIGVNDVLVMTSRAYPLLKVLRRQPWAKNPLDFEDHYARLLDSVSRKAERVVAVSPLFIGEDLSNPWNSELRVLSEIIEHVSSSFGAGFIDLQDVFVPLLKGKSLSPYMPKSGARMLLDSVLSRRSKKQEAGASIKDLHFTCDGVHLNHSGAKIAADAFLRVIEKISEDSVE
jgi:lysophospholipase L1-like esterase